VAASVRQRASTWVSASGTVVMSAANRYGKVKTRIQLIISLLGRALQPIR